MKKENIKVDKQVLIRAMQNLPEDATLNDALQALVTLDKLQRSLENPGEGKTFEQMMTDIEAGWNQSHQMNVIWMEAAQRDARQIFYFYRRKKAFQHI